ncbi:LysR family transcriptional regulator [Sedimenticola hydrogenitrophicus]|uniref:LysR family transcriptional regulator n=1 Tax=Sedimenticola hydrogenitrophicus TaxID=2967975 RepID=UPI0021A3AC61|nr:LysR family transcriptional regulator [Sedimenticola hydrogenitrophicus]
MNIEFARTFLKVVDTGSFIRAARALHVTQAAVSRRIRTLEQYLGCELFVRNKAGAVLTPSGRRFLRYAANMVQTLERARHEIGVAREFNGSLTIGGRFGLWDGLLLRLLERMRAERSDIQIRARIGFEEGLMQALVDGSLDIGIMYTPQNRPALQVERLLEEELVLVTSHRQGRRMPDPDSYVHVDWGPEFLAQLSGGLPELSSPRVIVGISWLGLQLILTDGGAGYFPYRLVRELIRQERLYRVAGAPSFQLPAYVVYPGAGNNPLIAPTVARLHRVAAEVMEETVAE